MPSKSANVKNEKQYEALKDKGMSKERAAKIANSPDASKQEVRNRTQAAATRRKAAQRPRKRPPAARAAGPPHARASLPPRSTFGGVAQERGAAGVFTE